MKVDFSQLAKEITKNCKNDKERVEALYRFVKEEIKYKITVIGDPEKILKLGYGSCIDKTILFSRLAKELGMETRYHLILIDIRALLKRTPFSKIVSSLPNTLFLPHTYPEVFIKGRWEKIDGPALDYDLERHFPGGLLRVVSKEGKQYIKDVGTFKKISDIISFPYIKELLSLFEERYQDVQKILGKVNDYLYKLRENKQEPLKGERDPEELKKDIRKLTESYL